MASDEFDIIQRYFNASALAFSVPELRLGIGDDCALLEMPPHSRLAMSMDLLQEGVHFPPDADPFLLGKRTLLVNLSDLAAMGARPVCFTLGLSLPSCNEQWLQRFSEGLAQVAQAHHCALVGGDLTASNPQMPSISICVQVHGELPKDEALCRNGAGVGDKIYVTGTLGDAAAGLAVLQNRSPESLSDAAKATLLRAFYEPESRIEAGQMLRAFATSCIDVSDGLASDLLHILKASGVGARIDVSTVPMSAAFCQAIEKEQRVDLALGGGDDYELCFTVPSELEAAMLQAAAQKNIAVTCIGDIRQGSDVSWTNAGQDAALNVRGYNHFVQLSKHAQGVA